MSHPIDEIEGIGEASAKKLRAAGIATTDALLEACADAKGRKAMAEKSGLSEALILRWTNHADLMRIKGVGKQFAELLEAAGVDTVKELKHRNGANLAAKLAEVNAARKLTGAVPAEKAVAEWIEQAKALPATITH
jgi:predicted flap endonuclease-1-like 5' DNA nuclease